jgi:hypothetical protein
MFHNARFPRRPAALNGAAAARRHVKAVWTEYLPFDTGPQSGVAESRLPLQRQQHSFVATDQPMT